MTSYIFLTFHVVFVEKLDPMDTLSIVTSMLLLLQVNIFLFFFLSFSFLSFLQVGKFFSDYDKNSVGVKCEIYCTTNEGRVKAHYNHYHYHI